MILDGVLYSVIHSGKVYYAYGVAPFSRSSKVFQDLFWSSMDVRCVSPSILRY